MSIPSAYQRMKATNPEMVKAYEALGAACAASGISIAAGLEGAAHSHCRKALEAGCTREELLHVANLSAPTIGWPAMMRARTWVTDVIDAAGAGS
jgi:alkylhydroperoxidase/carboxymuconolactone decarboxylase family protein YurZ